MTLNKGAIVEFAITDHVASASFGIHNSTSLFEQIVDDIVFGEEKFVAAPMSIFRPGTIAILLVVISGHSHGAEQERNG